MQNKKTASITFRLSPELKEALVQIAIREDRSVSQQVERFIKQSLQKYAQETPGFEHILPRIPPSEQNIQAPVSSVSQ